VVADAAAEAADERHLLVFANVDPMSLSSATLVAALGRSISSSFIAAEGDPRIIDDAVLGALEREAAPAENPSGAHHAGRWLWLILLLLMLAEFLFRRRQPTPVVDEARTQRRAA